MSGKSVLSASLASRHQGDLVFLRRPQWRGRKNYNITALYQPENPLGGKPVTARHSSVKK